MGNPRVMNTEVSLIGIEGIQVWPHLKGLEVTLTVYISLSDCS